MSQINDVERNLHELIQLITDSDTYQKYKLIEQKLNDNSTIKDLIAEIKHYQKNIVNLRYINKYEAVKEYEAKIEETTNKLNQFPIYAEYIDCINEINDLIIEINKDIQLIINEKTLKF